MSSAYPAHPVQRSTTLHAFIFLVLLILTLALAMSVTAAGQAIGLSPTSGLPGTTVVVSGKNWTFNNPKYPIFLDSVGGTQLGDFSPGKDGAWSTKITIPSRTSAGDHKIIACEGFGTRTQYCTAAAFKVTSPAPPTKPPPPTDTKKPPPITPTITPSPTSKPSSVRPPTPTDTGTPMPAAVPETGDSLLEPPRCMDLAMEPETLVIDFDGPGAPGLNPDAWFSYSHGVSFDGSAEIAAPGVTTASGSKALKSVETGEFGSTGIPLRMVFTRGVESIGMFVGMDGAPYTIGDITVALHVYGYREGEGTISELGYRYVTFPAGYTDIEYCLTYIGQEGDLISHAELDYLNSDSMPIGEPKLLDNLTIVYSPLELPADAPPDVTILQPETSTEYTGGMVEVRTDITEDRSLAAMWYELNGGPAVDLAILPGEDPGLYHAVFWLAAESLTPDVTNSLEVFARDSSSQVGSDRVDLLYDPPPTLDIRIDRTEVTQVIQTMHNRFPILDNNVPLFFDKPTLVRVYLRADGTEVDVPGISGQLCLDGDCITASNPVTVSPVDDPVADFRGDLSRTLNFLLPKAWIDSERFVSLMVTVNVDGADAEECCYADNEQPVTFSLERGRQLNVAMLRVEAHDLTTTNADKWPAIQWTQHNYPTQRVSVFNTTDEPLELNFDFTTRAGWESALEEVWWSNYFTDDPASDLYYHAMIPDGVDYSISGMGNMHRPESAAIWMVNEGATTAHELGHNMNLEHAPSDMDAAGNVINPDCEDPESPNNGYPQYLAADGSDLSRSSIGDWGIDLFASPWELKDPASTYDIMSYCHPRWMSLFTYEYLQDRIGWYAIKELPQIVSSDSLFYPTKSDVEYLVGGGRINPESFEVTRGFFVQPLPSDVQPPEDGGPFSVQLLDIDGVILNQRAFSLMNTDLAEDAPEGHFVVMVPWVPGTAEVVFMYQNEVLGRVPVTAHRPQIRLLTPNGGESWSSTGEEFIRWEAADPDGDTLTTYVQYSPDGGQSWHAVELDVTEMEITVDTSVLPGSSNALIRVCTTDGVNTACDVSYEPFEVEGKGPEIFISSPADGMQFPRGEEVIFEGLATDLEDGPIEEPQDFIWTSDKDGLLAKDYLFWGKPLSDGRHTIILTVSDRDGNQSSESVSIVILSAEEAAAAVLEEEISIPDTGEESPGFKLTPLQITLLVITFVVVLLVVVGLVVYILRLKKQQAGRDV